MELIQEITEFFIKRDCKCWIDCGNLLKLYRDGVVDMGDIDVGFLIKDYNKVLSIINSCPNIILKRKWRKEITIHYKNTRVDLFFCDTDEKYLYFYSYIIDEKTSRHNLEWRIKYPKEVYLPIKDYTFKNGLILPAPNDIERNLSLHYGDSWRIPMNEKEWDGDLEKIPARDKDYPFTIDPTY